MVKNYIFINIITLFQLFLLILIFEKNNCAIYLPFKLIESEIKDNFNNPSLIMKNWNNTIISSELLIGTPSLKINVFFLSNIYELNLFENMCDIPSSFYNKELSSTYNYIKNIKYLYNKVLNCSIINESIVLYTDENQKNKIILKGFNIIYSDNKKQDYKSNQKEYEYLPNTCLNIGFRPSQSISFGYDLNFVGQIKHYKIEGKSIIKNYDFTFKYSNNNQGFLVIGEKPHEFDRNNFREEQFFTIGSKNNKFTSDWFLEIDKIYYTGISINDGKEYNRDFYSDLSVKFDLNLGLILGNKNYEINIKKDFFDSLIDKHICFSEEIDNEYRIYYCDKKNGINYIEKYFPVLKFCMKQLGFCFDFNYKDLFKEKDDKIYFLVYFNLKDYLISSRFTLGQILIKKYSLTFNYDTKLIGFYDTSKKVEASNDKEINGGNNNASKKTGTVIMLIISFVVFIGVGFLLGKKIYERTRKKKANELIDDYEYETNDINSNSKNNCLNVEMNSKYNAI